MCGENKNRSPNTSPHMGSSPRVRGKQSAFRHGTRLTGLIPACAGKTVTRRRPAVCQRAHPRVCGENGFSIPGIENAGGSSPRVRGKLTTATTAMNFSGLIPACAGKTGMMWSASALLGAHPRVCGENADTGVAPRSWEGSSPRVRGKLATPVAFQTPNGLIPACAGKTPRGIVTSFGLWAHPRVCGENPVSSTHSIRPPGSSPRVRGKLCGFLVCGLFFGLIPACAGKTPAASANWQDR